MKLEIRLVLAERGCEFIRHARCETLRGLGCDAGESCIEPFPGAAYLFAYEEGSGRPIGMAEAAFHHQVYPSYEGGPYPSFLKLSSSCPFGEMVGLRTVYVEPEFRLVAPIYLYLILCATRVFESLGASFGTATTTPGNRYLRRLYDKTGGDFLGTFPMGGQAVSLYLFEVAKLMRNRIVRRALGVLDLDPAVMEELRSRGAVAKPGGRQLRAAGC